MTESPQTPQPPTPESFGVLPVPSDVDKQVRNWTMFCHLAALAALIGIPFGNILGPLIIWLIKREEHPLVNEQGKEALNFQISMTIYSFVAGLLCFVIIGLPLPIGMVVLNLVMIIIAAVKTFKGEPHRYPITIRLIK